MTHKQLDLLLQYINLKARVEARGAAHQPVSDDATDRMAQIIGDLEDSIAAVGMLTL